MSGGSFDYLFTKDLVPDRLDDMADELAETFPHSRAARDTRRIAEAAGASDELRDVWHDIEWWRSGDYGPEQAREAIEKYEHAGNPGGDVDRPAVRSIQRLHAALQVHAGTEDTTAALVPPGDVFTFGDLRTIADLLSTVAAYSIDLRRIGAALTFEGAFEGTDGP